MCVVCNSVETIYSKTAYLAVETDILNTFNVPVANGLLENHSLENGNESEHPDILILRNENENIKCIWVHFGWIIAFDLSFSFALHKL